MTAESLMTTKRRQLMMRRTCVAGLIVATAVAMEPLATRLTAFATNGHTWGIKQIPYYINPANKYMSDSSAVAGITSAASTWKGVANISLSYAGYTTKSSLTNDGVNAVFFRDDASGYIAETYWWWDGTGHLVDADIVYHENYKFYSGNMGCNGDGYYIENTGSHEFGHLLGLAHSSVDTAAMWPNSGACETIRETLDPDDLAGIQSLYPGSLSTPTLTAPTAPTGLTAGASSASPSSSIALAWSDTSTNEAGYMVERSADGASFSQRAQLSSGAASFVDSGLTAGATYYYRVYAFNSAGASPYSNVASGATQGSSPAPTPTPTPTPAPTAPTAPSNPTPGNGATGVNANNMTLGWSGNATSYDLYLNGALVASNLKTTSWRTSGNGGATYSWMVVAKNAAGSTSGPAWSFSTKSTGKK
jgi:hypothetical protein